MEPRWNSHARHIYSDMSGQLFQLSVKKGYDSVKFAEIALTTFYGHMVYDDLRANEWLADTYLMSGYEREFKEKLVKGNTYSLDIMYFCGYLYRYWGITEDIPINEVYKLAPIEWLASNYEFYHTQGEEYIIKDIKRKRGIE